MKPKPLARVDAFALVEAIRQPGRAQVTASGIKKPSCLSALGATVINKLRLQALGGLVKPFLFESLNLVTADQHITRLALRLAFNH